MTSASAGAIAKAHHNSFQNEVSRRRVLMFLYGPAAVTTGVCVAAHWLAPDVVSLASGVADPLAGGLALLAGLLFALGVTVLEKSMEMDQTGPAPSRETSSDAERLTALSANALFTGLLAGMGTAMVILAGLIPPAAWAFNAVAVGLVVAVGSAGVKVSGRLFAETKRRANRARTGLSRDRRDDAS